MIERDWNKRLVVVPAELGELGLGIDRRLRQVRVDEVQRPRRRRERLAQEPLLRSEDAEQRHFVDAGGVGDAPRRGAARAVLGEDLERRFEQQFAGIHRDRA